MAVQIHARTPHSRVPLDKLQTADGALRHGNSTFSADPLDALLLCTVRQLPQDANGAYAAGAREFGRVLALLRQASSNCELIEEGRVRRMEVLDEPPRPTLNIALVSNSATECRQDACATNGDSRNDAALRVTARVGFRCAETGRALGQPAARDAAYWTFESAVTPPPNLPDDPLLRGLFEKSCADAAEFVGIVALDLLCRARANANRISVHVDPAIAALSINFEPLREKICVGFDENDEIELVRELFTQTGKPVPYPVAPASRLHDSNEDSCRRDACTTGLEWLEINGVRHRLPIKFSGHALVESLPPELPRVNPNQSRHKIADDDIPAFVLNVLPKLKNLGAKVDGEIENIGICLTLKPALHIEADDEDGVESVRASFHFEPAAPFRKSDSISSPRLCVSAKEKIEITPIEILAAAAEGRKYIRRGNDFFRVDRELVASSRKKLEDAGSATAGEFDARGEQIPKLLAWARDAAHDEHTPWNCYIAEHVAGAHKIKDEPAAIRVKLDVDEEDGKDAWFTLSAEFDHGGVTLSEEELRKLAEEGREWFLKNGTWIRIDKNALKKFDASLSRTALRAVEDERSLFNRHARRRAFYRFRPAERERVISVFSIAGSVEHNERYRKFLDQLMGFEAIQALPLPKALTLTPRPYQQKGFEWLAFLARYGLNGVLADDMGLGKTAQTIAQLTRMKEEFGSMPSLIVTPTSLADNWRAEFEKFSPQMRVMIYRGSPSRRDKLRSEILVSSLGRDAAVHPSPLGGEGPGVRGGFDVVIATLGTVRNDASLLREIAWRYVIVDEAHFIKNSAAGVAKAIKTIPAQHRLALTGTPIQNRLGELWSLFDFLMPGFLGRQAHFAQQFEEPILRMQSGRAESDEEYETGKNAADRLREKIFPFVLRRLKTDVATDLPPKIESDIFCPLTPEQTSLYTNFGESDEAKRAVSEIVEKGDGSSPAILAALMGLRKICNHPDLLYLPKDGRRQHVAEPIPGYESRSGKLEVLGELLEECREGGHRALIFCQLVSMLDILAHFVTKNGFKFMRIDGETPGQSRQKLVEQFNADATIDTFLISTRAGGAGLNLTGADTVIFYDHDWNPANDQQAQDRAYRIGQTRTVNVYRLICKGTLEEKILRRQALKRALANSIVTHDVAGVKDLSREELLSLFTLGR
ncbi:MAG TPA: DEAD/DEAH box helicase [Planctomycetota bacterium]|nr:DEAD/DEAH box helicase [Planctomycetota bacterium]